MQQADLKEYKLKLPVDLIKSISEKEIIDLLANKALNKMEYYQSKNQKMEETYKTAFDVLKKKVDNSDKEEFKEWDDLILWEGYILGYKEWKKKYEELKYCMG